MDHSTNVSNINVAPRYSKFEMYWQQYELVSETYLEPLISEQEAEEVSDNESEVDGQAKNKGAFKKYGLLT